MSDGVQVQIKGVDELKAALLALPNKLRRRALRNALALGARLIRDEARRLTPAITVPIYRGNGMIRRAPGTVRKAITVRTSKQARRRGDVGVFVNVRPAKGAYRGANKPFDPFYWRFLEFGWTTRSGKRIQPVGMLAKAAEAKGREAIDRMTAAVKPAIDKLNRGQTP